MPAGYTYHVTISQKHLKRHHLDKLISVKSKARYDFTLIIHFNASSKQLITLLYTKRTESKPVRIGRTQSESNVPGKSLPVRNLFYVLDSTLCATIEHLSSNGNSVYREFDSTSSFND